MMFGKTLHFCNAVTGTCIMASGDPKEQKKLGSSVEGFSDSRWSYMKEKVVVQGNCYRFSQNARLREALLAEGERELREASRRDKCSPSGSRHNMNINELLKRREELSWLFWVCR